jgi:hypothetical protein
LTDIGIVIKTQHRVTYNYLFIYPFLYLPGLVPKPTSQDEENPEESKTRKQEQQRR